ncbi:FdhF/YdeP family oxidoreductase [Marinoscillum furvescens]|uniref:Molybdopterin-dependent oxidoreductase alpha subunit n=1 Tax=Marinoscillum furvescens DSM 4134 TaxID=1122208 RepID=A0A3D9L8J9_MARFU|nr:FdhF/YdeP family oxidoreductase [Marinoscillum furvescens]REE01197.1 molybdopterin-dependent oxidoreductase alpha subunit [Marinoscillum furvescens DSM 4134]
MQQHYHYMSDPTPYQRNISITGTIGFEELRRKAPASYAAGLPAVKVALEHAAREAGLIRSVKTLAHMNQKDGFDCPGCAWPDPDDRSKLGEYCENGAKALAEEATLERVDEQFFRKYSVEELSRLTDFEIGKSGRITRPFVLRPGSVHYEPIEWEEAYALVGEHLRQLASPDEAVFYTSGRSSNEAAFLYGLFARSFGTNNMPDCSNMCHESSGVALSETLGIGKGSVTLDDFKDAEVVMVIGQNPGTNHPRMLSALQQCKENGGKIIAVNPLRESGLVRFKNPQQIKGVLGGGAALTDIYLQVKINQDVALLKLIMKRLLMLHREGCEVFDEAFINEKTSGYKQLVASLDAHDEVHLQRLCGVPFEQVDQAVELLAARKRIIICWAMGLTQHKNGVDNIKECVNLLLLKGSIGKKGAGTCAVRGHSNVQGDRTVGIVHHVSPAFNQALKDAFGFDPPAREGLDTVHAIQAMHEGKAKIFVALGGNFVSAASDTAYTARALQNCELTVSVSTKLNRTHLVAGKTALILPTLGRSEADLVDGKARYVTVENSMGKVHRSQGRLRPASELLRSEPEIVAGIADACFQGAGPVDWCTLGSDYERIREKISEVIAGFEQYSERSAGGGFYLPNNAREADFSKLPGGKAQFSLCKLAEHTLDEESFLLMTIRSHDQFNTTIYGLDDRYRGIFNERRIVMMNAEDMKRKGLKEEQVVHLTSHYDGVERRAECFKVVPYDIPEGNLAAYFPETNLLVPINHYADKSNTPISKSIVVRVEVG